MTSMPEQPSEAELPAEAEQPAETEQPEAAEPAEVAEPAAVEEPEFAPDEPIVVDERLFHAHDLARAALREVTPESTIGEAAGYVVEDGGVVSLRFANRMDGYPGWFWTVSVAVVEGAEPTVLEVELLPGDGALLAPEWLPWAERLAEYQAAQAAAGEDDESEDDERSTHGRDGGASRAPSHEARTLFAFFVVFEDGAQRSRVEQSRPSS